MPPSQKLIDEFEKRIESIRLTYNDEQMLSLLRSLDQSPPWLVQTPLSKGEETAGTKGSINFSSQQKETPPPPPPPAPSRDAYFYLYVQRHERLSRLNVTKLAEAPVFELVCDFGRSHRRNNCLSPVVCFNVKSEIFMVGDVFIRQEQRPNFCKPFFDLFSAKPAPSFLPCPPTISRGPTAPKVDPLVIPLHGKFYVLALNLYMDHPCFEVFNNGNWKPLPLPPYFPHTEREGRQNLLDTRMSFDAHYAWDHKIVVCLEGGSYCFDTQKGAWTDMQHIYTQGEEHPLLQCVAKYDEFLIAKPLYSEELLVYELGADGFPHLHQNLDGLEEMFADSGIKGSSSAFIIPFDDDADKFCFICSGVTPSTDMDRSLEFLLRVGVFRMTISNLDGKKKVTAVLEAHQIYPFYNIADSSFFPDICSAFLKRDVLNLDNLKADQSLGRACLD